MTTTKPTSTLPPFYFIGGYANSGKSTLIANLKQNFNVLVVSASEEVHHQYRLAHRGKDLDTKLPSLRKQFIEWVEGYHIPYLGGREFFAASLIDKALANLNCSNPSAVVVETVGGVEFEYMMGALPYDVLYRCYNCNRDDSTPGVDLRVPLEGANELNCNSPWALWEYRSWFPELTPRLMLPIPDAVSRYLGYQVEHSCLAASPDGGGEIYSLTGQVEQPYGVGDGEPIEVDEPTLEKILSNLSELRSGSFEWGCTKIKVTSSGTVSLIKVAELLGVDKSLFFPRYDIAMELFGYPASCKHREQRVYVKEVETNDYVSMPSPPFVSAAPAPLRTGLVGNIQLSRQMVARI